MLRAEIFKKYDSIEDLEKKEEELRISLLVNGNDVKNLKELGFLTYYKKDYSSAIRIFKKLIELEPRNSNFIAFLGYLYYENDEYEKSVDYYLKALEISKNMPFVYFLLGNVYSRIGNIVEAIKCYDLAIFSEDDIYDIHIDFGKKYEEIGSLDRALKEYKTAYEIDPRNKKILEKISELSKKMS